MKKIKEYFKDKSAEQIFSLCLLISCALAMMLCMISRLCGILWFTADLTIIEEPDIVIQEIVKALLLIIELIFIYKILCRTTWLKCAIISVCETVVGVILGFTVNNYIVSNLYYMLCMLIIPIPFVKKWTSILENMLMYLIGMLYGIIFLVGRIGNLEVSSYNFVCSVLGTIDYKLFIISFYLFIKYFGGIKLWKKQKTLIFQTDLRQR